MKPRKEVVWCIAVWQLHSYFHMPERFTSQKGHKEVFLCHGFNCKVEFFPYGSVSILCTPHPHPHVLPH